MSDGYYDPQRFPEALVLHAQASEAKTAHLDTLTNAVLMLRFRDDGRSAPKYELRVLIDGVLVLELRVLAYEHAGRKDSLDYPRYRFSSCKPLPRVHGYKIELAKVRADDRFFEATPSIPTDANWLLS